MLKIRGSASRFLNFTLILKEIISLALAARTTERKSLQTLASTVPLSLIKESSNTQTTPSMKIPQRIQAIKNTLKS